ncbi:MAG: hypothetical protein H6707_19305 [Deltaproteobacteria bacterium]|nr:hypothetical protein [Deltaproteobacteria bacterium]
MKTQQHFGFGLTLTLMLGLSSAAQAEASLRITPCSAIPFDAVLLRKQLSLELSAVSGLVEATIEAGACTAAVDRLTVRYRKEDRSLVVDELSLRGLPKQGAERQIALMVSELLRGTLALGGGVSAKVRGPARVVSRPAVADPRPPAVPPAAEAQTPALLIGFGPGVQLFPSFSGALFEAQTTLWWRPAAGPWRLSIGAAFGGAEADDPLGRIKLLSARGQASLQWVGDNRRGVFAIGPQIDLGWARVSGLAADPAVSARRVSDTVLIAGFVGDYLQRLGRGVALGARLAVGYTVRGLTARADDRRATGLAGPQLALHLIGAFGWARVSKPTVAEAER